MGVDDGVGDSDDMSVVSLADEAEAGEVVKHVLMVASSGTVSVCFGNFYQKLILDRNQIRETYAEPPT